MGFFDKITGKKENVDWSNAHLAKPIFYRKPEGEPFGTFALAEGAETILPKNPQNQYRYNEKPIAEWNISFVSITKKAVIGGSDYFSALKKLEKYTIDANEEAILVRGLSLKELERLL